MNKRLSIMASVFLASFALAIAGAGIAYADDDGDSGEFRWLAATGFIAFDLFPDAHQTMRLDDPLSGCRTGVERRHDRDHRRGHSRD